MSVDEYLQKNYLELPSLSDLIQLLSPTPGSRGIFDIQANADTIDYEDLGYQVEILGVALSGINSYVAQERRPPSHIDMLRTAIDVIHGKIGMLSI
jgi:hypothetical protein